MYKFVELLPSVKGAGCSAKLLYLAVFIDNSWWFAWWFDRKKRWPLC